MRHDIDEVIKAINDLDYIDNIILETTGNDIILSDAFSAVTTLKITLQSILGTKILVNKPTNNQKES